jgi:pyruvate/2-oxoglutarate dehydrogenase complex dihydrolipoamide acyltransferase (E2) component
MSSFIIDVPMPSMGATVSELTIINIVVAPGAVVAKGQKLADLESDKSAFDFESPAAGTILEVKGTPGSVKRSGEALFRMETSDASLSHLAVGAASAPAAAPAPAAPAAAPASAAPAAAPAKALVWTPRALKLAQEAGLDPATITGIEATGPGGRLSGDDVAKYLASRK